MAAAAASIVVIFDGGAAVTAAPVQVPDTCNVITPNVPVTSALLTSGLPCKAQFVPPFNIVTLQHGFDFYSWLTFLALNSPADGQTVIGKGHGVAGDAPTIWEGWKDIDSVMRTDGSAPTPWGAPTPVPAACKGIFEPGMAVVSMVGKTPNVLSAISEPFKTGPLIDQNGNFTRYDILMNHTMFDYIVGNQLYNVVGQKKFAGAVDFPAATVPGNPPPIRRRCRAVSDPS
jgi:hypothetical protein